MGGDVMMEYWVGLKKDRKRVYLDNEAEALKIIKDEVDRILFRQESFKGYTIWICINGLDFIDCLEYYKDCDIINEYPSHLFRELKKIQEFFDCLGLPEKKCDILLKMLYEVNAPFILDNGFLDRALSRLNKNQ